ncbi:MAG TPA: YcnI family protein [Actinopolymorphaceae bacterium]|jgi:uncharacterized protein YcnI
MPRTLSRTSPVPIHPPITRRRHLARAVVGGLLAAAVVFLTAASASAHVHIDASTTEPGANAILTFRVPTESETARTTKAEVTLPSDDPFPSVSANALAGWTVGVTEAKLPTPVVDDDGATLTKAPHTVRWTARAGAAVGPGEFQEFELQVGPLPKSGAVVLPVTQTYSDGSVVKWDGATPPGGEEPEHPAPSFDIAAAPAVTSSDSASTTDGTARTLGIVGIVVGAIGAGIGLTGLAAARRRTSS